MLQLLTQFHDLAPLFTDFLAALMTVCTTLQALLMFAGMIFPKAKAAAHWVGIAALDLGKVAAFLGKGKVAAKVTTITLLSLCLGGCSGFLHAQDPTTDHFITELCDQNLANAAPDLQKQAISSGIPLDKLEEIFHAACMLRAVSGLAGADHAGMDAVVGAVQEKIGAKGCGAP